MEKNESSEPAQSRRPAARRAVSEPPEPVTGVTTAARATRVTGTRQISSTSSGSSAPTPGQGGPTRRIRARRSDPPGELAEPRGAALPADEPELPEAPSELAADSGEPALQFAQSRPLAVSFDEASDEAALARMELAEDFGLDLGYDAKLRPLLETLCRSYFHIKVSGAHNIPAHGRALLVANHTRSLPWDGIMLRTALRLQHDAGRELRWLVEDDQFHAPFLGTFLSRLGAVRACQENAERLLLREELLAVFPEGNKGAQKRYDERYRLQRFGRGGYVKLALRTGAPVLPVAIVGGEDAAWGSKSSGASRWAQFPFFALRRSMRQFGALGVPPLPSRWRIVIGAEVKEIARQDAAATSDDGLIHELNECVRSAVQQLVDTNVSGNA
jgi:hypothetical protein